VFLLYEFFDILFGDTFGLLVLSHRGSVLIEPVEMKRGLAPSTNE